MIVTLQCHRRTCRLLESLSDKDRSDRRGTITAEFFKRGWGFENSKPVCPECRKSKRA